MIIQVKNKHIKLGERQSTRHCPVALAIKDVLCQLHIGFITVDVDNKNVIIDHTYIIPLPQSARRFINRLDQYGKKDLRAFNFRLVLYFRLSIHP